MLLAHAASSRAPSTWWLQVLASQLLTTSALYTSYTTYFTGAGGLHAQAGLSNTLLPGHRLPSHSA